MTETNAITTFENSDADEAYARVLPEAQALAVDQLVPINLDMSSVIIKAMGLAEKLPGLQPELQTLAPYPAEDVAKYPDYVLALLSAQSRYAMTATPAEPLPDLLAQATHWRDTLLADAQALAVRGQLNTEPLNELVGYTGYKNVAFDLNNLTRLFKTAWSSIEGKTQLTKSDLQQADKVMLQLAAALAHRELSPEQIAEASDIRQRMFTLVYLTYDEIRRGVNFLRWHQGDVDTIVPSLYAGRGNSNITHKSNGDTNKPTTPVPTPAATGTAMPGSPTPPAAKLPVGHMGGDPFTS